MLNIAENDVNLDRYAILLFCSGYHQRKSSGFPSEEPDARRSALESVQYRSCWGDEIGLSEEIYVSSRAVG